MSGLRTRAALGLGRAVGWVSRVSGRGAGTHVGGRVMLAIDPDLLASTASGRSIAIVSATNGKTTTSRMLAEALRANGHVVASNHTGANLPPGIAVALGRDPEARVAVLEVDERWLPHVVGPVGAELLVLGNLTRDQLDRFGEVRSVAEAWRATCEQDPSRPVVANASDPHVVWAAGASERVTWVALGAPWRADAATCPRCAALLAWSDESFACPACGFAQPDAQHRLDGDTVVVAGRCAPLHLAVPGSWNRMNAALALVAAVTHFGVPLEVARCGIERVAVVSGRFATRRLPDRREAPMILAKNPAGWTEVLRWLHERDDAVVLAVNARLADGRDPSWLWDVPYELLRDRPVAASGERALDVAVRLDYGGVECIVEPDPLRAATRLPGTRPHVIASYTQFTRLTRRSW